MNKWEKASLMRQMKQIRRPKLTVVNSGYSNYGASRTKKSMIGWNWAGGSPNEDINDNLDVLRQRSRDLYMGVPLATAAVRMVRTNVVGSGLKLKAQVDADFLVMTDEEADAWERNTEREFALWADTVHCDAARMNNFGGLQHLAVLSWLMSGDVFALLPYVPRVGSIYDLRVHLVEADRVCNPPVTGVDKDIQCGVELGQYGEPVAYWITKYHPLSKQAIKNEWVRVEAYGAKTGRRNVLHLMESERPGQRRGVPFLAPVIEALKQLGRYTDAELMAAVVSGMFTVFIKSNTPEAPIGEGMPVGDLDLDYDYDYELGNGSIVALAPGEDVKEVNPGRPNTAFDGFVTAVCRQIGTALEIPYEVLIKHFTASYSASRGALMEAWKMFKMRRTWLATNFCQPVYEEWLTEAILKGRVSAPGFFDDPAIKAAYCRAEWNGPAPGQIDPEKEAKAAKIRVEEGFSTRARETAELTGGDWEVNHRQRVKEERLRREGQLIQGGANGEKILADQKPDPDE